MDKNTQKKRVSHRGERLDHYCIRTHKKIILDQYDFDINYPFTPKDFTKTSSEFQFFTYEECGHTCYQRICNKTGSKINKCPKCLNRGGIGKSLADIYPYETKMFDSAQNGITATKVTHKCGKKYKWKCQICGAIFEGKVSDVVTGHRRCKCVNDKRSQCEYILEYYLKTLDNDIQVNYKIGRYKFDIYLKKYNLVIEYDGYPWHDTETQRKNDIIKDKICDKEGIKILRIRDKKLKVNNQLSADIWEIDSVKCLEKLGTELKKYIGDDVDSLNIDLKRDIKNIEYYCRYENKNRKSIKDIIPDIDIYLDPDNENNGNSDLIRTESHKIRLALRHPFYKQLKWSITAHQLFRQKHPFNGKIKMCIKVLGKFPELESQIVEKSKEINENTLFEMKCKCGKTIEKKYTALVYSRDNIMRCPDCLKDYRVNNIHPNLK